MAIIAGKDLCEILDRGVVVDMLDPELQVQICGVDLTLRSIERFVTRGAVDYDNRERQVSKTEEIAFDDDGWAALDPGCYLVTFNEAVSIPKAMTALARPRSSLLRSGATVETALWDPGYRGRSQSLLVVHNPKGLLVKKNARLIQLAFYRLSAILDKGYEGAYQNENL
ncbi:deoxyuridine 5'-triphosphate nucleotidohydrolase [Methanotrichaceae archaeon M04Ac]|uniref:Deoxyuridine 5'-triphosphate nucleotidohydrolase n=1 Tax=Candidatus Methanocrinis alkalitolerans TaxID=3033395 RepID=A0ABT5XGL2_9EURY|nr:deoxyuridine 5'-triphosphate nucleotidohydrolase [Candidatus Methanocrinis alkalitolerans]MCR3884937.1 deoxyuridine 5'-triphosphate nucleotidohydrolase [Methanothrix sp.]MDF0593844.1 deoxyuridine 5'-triphosphate nucleotidohydrolase [Candidatus Methanocrinis alkalitolerans]